MAALRRRRATPGDAQPFSRAERDVDLGARGTDGRWAAALDARVESLLPSVVSLSELTTALALDYLERVHRPFPALTLASGARLTTRAYVAHLAVEEDPVAFGATDVPVLGGLPPARHGRPPQGLLTRVVKASRRDFAVICALSPQTWEGFVTCALLHTHDDAAAAGAAVVDGQSPWLSRAVVDGLARVGWVLRQVDLHYGQSPERA
ncbi:MAG: hypothetical protein ACYC1D_17240 [Acidimicrobiales bacterium]